MPKLKLAAPAKPKVIGIVGSRRRAGNDDYLACRAAFMDVFRDGDRIVSGGCPAGGDHFAEIIARGMGLTITVHHADWRGKGKAAGFVRNTRIAEDADVLIALIAADRLGGTEDTIRKALKLNKQVIYV